MGFPADWNGSKIKFDIQTNEMRPDIKAWTFHLTKQLDLLFRKQNGILHGDGSNPMKPFGEDIRFTSDELGEHLLDIQIKKAEVKRHPAWSLLDVAVIVPYVSNNDVTTIYLWWGNPNATIDYVFTQQVFRPLSDTGLDVVITDIS